MVNVSRGKQSHDNRATVAKTIKPVFACVKCIVLCLAMLFLLEETATLTFWSTLYAMGRHTDRWCASSVVLLSFPKLHHVVQFPPKKCMYWLMIIAALCLCICCRQLGDTWTAALRMCASVPSCEPHSIEFKLLRWFRWILCGLNSGFEKDTNISIWGG